MISSFLEAGLSIGLSTASENGRRPDTLIGSNQLSSTYFAYVLGGA